MLWSHSCDRSDPRAARVSAASFEPPRGAREVHLTIEPPPGLDVRAAASAVGQAYAAALSELRLPASSAVFRRLFVSDAANGAAWLADDPIIGGAAEDTPVALSLIEQPPLPGRRLALWAYHVDDPEAPLSKERHGRTVRLVRPGRAHLWTAGLTARLERPTIEATEEQTRAVFASYERELARNEARLADHVMRTWLFVRDVDRHYGGMVAARRDLFVERGLTAETHFIASTGIEGRTARPDEVVVLDAWAVAGLDPAQVEHLAAPGHLGPTMRYGVTFERGTRIAYGDRRHVVISGTASVDPDGHVVGIGDIDTQLRRTADNVDALLEAAGADTADLALLIVYVRDAADELAARRAVRDRYGDVPHVLVHAPVCRPTWLVEIEALAIAREPSPEWPTF